MGMFQEAAILMGDKITVPIKARIVSEFTGKTVHIDKDVRQGALLSDGSISSFPAKYADCVDHISLQTGEHLFSTGKDVKHASWKIVVEDTEKTK